MIAAVDALAYVIVGWTVTVAAIVAFAVATVRRERRLMDVVPPEERRWS